MGKAWLNSQDPNRIINFKNRIINGDMQVRQRGSVFGIKNDEEFTADRWVTSTADDNEIEVRCEDIYSLHEGSLADNTDPFGDGSLIHFFPLRKNATDLITGNSGTVNGNITFNNKGVSYIGDSAYFDGDGDYIDTGINSFPSQDGSVSIWYKNLAIDSSGCLIHFSKDGENTFSVWGSSDSGGTLIYVGFNDNGYYISIDKSFFKVFNNLIITSDGKIYLNGNLIKDTKESIDLSTINKNILIGVDRDTDDSLNEFFYGYVQQVRIFNRILSEDEVKKLYVEDSQYIFKKHLRTNLITKGTTYTVTPYEYRFEGQHLADILSSKDKATLSFEFASNVNKDYTIRLYYPDGTLYDSKTFTYSGSGEFTRHSVTFDFSTLDLTKVNLDENLGMVLTIAENDELDAGDYLKVTNVQFERGTIATEFEVLPYEVQLDRCLRYYEVMNDGDKKYLGVGFIENTNYDYRYWVRYSLKRIEPSVRISFANTWIPYWTGESGEASNVIVSNIFKDSCQVYLTECTTGTDGYPTLLLSTAKAYLNIDAELPGRGE